MKIIIFKGTLKRGYIYIYVYGYVSSLEGTVIDISRSISYLFFFGGGRHGEAPSQSGRKVGSSVSTYPLVQDLEKINMKDTRVSMVATS